MSNPFLTASRLKLRFKTDRNAQLSVEDLWDLSLKDLDRIAIAVDAQLSTTSKSFLENPDRKAGAEAEANALRLDILKALIEVRQTENKITRESKARETQLAFLEDLLAKKQVAALEGLTEEQIKKQIADLKGVPAPEITAAVA